MTNLTTVEMQVLRSTLAFLEREAARRAKGTHPGMMRFSDAELAVVVALLRRELEADRTPRHDAEAGAR